MGLTINMVALCLTENPNMCAERAGNAQKFPSCSRLYLALVSAAIIVALIVAWLWMAGQALAQDADKTLDTIFVTETTNEITREVMERKTAANLWELLKGVAGINLSLSGGKNESYILIRGATRDQVGMYIDGVPIATVYWNEFDLSNTLTFDLASVEVSKGYSSSLLASNNGIAGVVNIRTAKPQKELEFRVKYMNYMDRSFSDRGRLFGLTLGTRQPKYYAQASVVQNEQEFFSLSKNFTPSRYEDGGRRENSDFKNRRFNFLAGYTPNEDVDIMVGLVRQEYEKGQAFSVTDDRNPPGSPFGNPRFWRWPEYETDRYYINGNFNLTAKASLKVVGYYDKHLDVSAVYTDHTLERLRLYSTYDEFTAGAHATFEYLFNEANKMVVSSGYRRVSHKGFDENVNPTPGPKFMSAEYIEDNYDFGAEYTFRPIDPLSFVLGASYTMVKPNRIATRTSATAAWSEPDDKGATEQNLFGYQLGVFYDITPSDQIFFTFAKKNRPASMRQRFQRSSGVFTTLDLKPEEAFHYEIGYKGYLTDWIKLSASFFHTNYTNKILGYSVSEVRNVNKSKTFGTDLSVEADFSDYVSGGLTFSWLHWRTETSAQGPSYISGSPKFSGSAYLSIRPTANLTIIPEFYARSSYYDSDSATYEDFKASGFATADLKAVYSFKEHFSVEAGIKNILDKNYSFTDGYPGPGRNFFIGLNAEY
jgi:iron complex outermembrane receptor protein